VRAQLHIQALTRQLERVERALETGTSDKPSTPSR
jgi:hypothetical protein